MQAHASLRSTELAHVALPHLPVQHMLFYSSEKYPVEDEYS